MKAVICDCCKNVVKSTKAMQVARYNFSAVIAEPYYDPLFDLSSDNKYVELDLCQDCLDALIAAAKEHGRSSVHLR